MTASQIMWYLGMACWGTESNNYYTLGLCNLRGTKRTFGGFWTYQFHVKLGTIILNDRRWHFKFILKLFTKYKRRWVLICTCCGIWVTLSFESWHIFPIITESNHCPPFLPPLPSPPPILAKHSLWVQLFKCHERATLLQVFVRALFYVCLIPPESNVWGMYCMY